MEYKGSLLGGKFKGPSCAPSCAHGGKLHPRTSCDCHAPSQTDGRWLPAPGSPAGDNARLFPEAPRPGQRVLTVWYMRASVSPGSDSSLSLRSHCRTLCSPLSSTSMAWEPRGAGMLRQEGAAQSRHEPASRLSPRVLECARGELGLGNPQSPAESSATRVLGDP